MPEVIRLTRDLTQPIDASVWPEGVSVTPFTGTIAPAIHDLMKLAYAQGFGSTPEDFDTWWAATRHDAEFDASLCFVAAAGEQPVGLALCWTSSFVKDLVVHPARRGQGIGRALLLLSLRALAARGSSVAALKVHADNTRARRLYESVGFRA